MGLRGYQPHRREQAVADIEAMIRRQELWGRRLPGEREMAEELGISRGTLQRALELLEARGVVLRRHGSGTFAARRGEAEAAATRKAARLAILAAPKCRPVDGWTYYGDMVKGALRGCRRLGVGVEVLPLEEVWLPGPGPRWPQLKDFAGFVLVERDDPALVRQILRLRRGPLAILDSTFRDLPAIGVVDGSFEGARRAVSHLVHLGHRRIAYFAPGETPEAPHEKSQGYQSVLAEAEIPYDPRLVIHATDDAAEAEAGPAFARLLALADPPTALFAGTDRRALAALRALEARGRRVGQDFAVIGFGDSAFRSGECDRLSSVRIHTRQMGEAAVRAVLAAGRTPQARTVIVPDRLIVRQSTCRLARTPLAASARAGARVD